MIQIQPKKYTTGVAVKMMLDVAICADLESGYIHYALFSEDNKKVTEGSLGIDAEYIAANYKDYDVAAQKITNYLGVVIL
jgi:hypothetical protein